MHFPSGRVLTWKELIRRTSALKFSCRRLLPRGRIHIRISWLMTQGLGTPGFHKQHFWLVYHVVIWQVAPQLSCGATSQISTWYINHHLHALKFHDFESWVTSRLSWIRPPGSVSISQNSSYTHILWSIESPGVGLELLDHSKIWQTSPQQCCGAVC